MRNSTRLAIGITTVVASAAVIAGELYPAELFVAYVVVCGLIIFAVVFSVCSCAVLTAVEALKRRKLRK